MVKLVGILNLTPDSFSDGGRYNNHTAALKHAEELIADGADIIDVGAESTRPGAVPISQVEEWSRLKAILPEIIKIADKHHKAVSVDTRNAKTADEALKLGVKLINDVSAFSDPKMSSVIKEHNATIVFNHNLGVPADRKITVPENENIIDVLKNWASKIVKELTDFGIPKKHIIFDVGIGFGKTPVQSLQILSNLEELKNLGVAIYVGHSRKSFLNNFEPRDNQEKDNLTAIFSSKIAAHVDYLRVHNVKMTKFMIENF